VTAFGIIVLRIGVGIESAADIAAAIAAFGCAAALAAVGRREYRLRAALPLALIRVTSATAALVGMLTVAAVLAR
jgi:hypothetical protein